MSPAGDQAYFGDGIAEELLNELTRLEGLSVASRTSSFSFRDSNATAQAIGENLDVNLVLEGSVRTDANRLRITAQLINVENGYHHWSETYDRQLNDIFAVQDEIASSVAGVLGVTLGVGNVNSFWGAGTDNFEAYETYLRANSSFDADERQTLLEQAIELDPDYAAPLALLGLSIAGSMWTHPVEEAPGLIERGIEYINRAVEISPESAYAYSLLATANYARFNWAESEEYYRRALETEQVADYLSSHGHMMMRTGRSSAAIRNYELAFEDTSDIVQKQSNHVFAYIAMGEFERAEELISQMRLETGQVAEYYMALNNRDIATIRRLMSEVTVNEPIANQYLRPIIDSLDSPSETLELLQSLHENTEVMWAAKHFDIAMFAAVIGEPEFALEVYSIEGVLTPVRLGSIWFPIMAEARRLPEFKQLVTDINLMEYWRAYGWPDHCRPLGEDDFECS